MAAHPHKWGYRPGGRRFETPHEYAEAWGKYFDACHAHKLIPTFAGAAIHMQVVQKTLREYGARDEFKDVHKAAIEYLEAMVIDRLFKPGPVGAIFYLLNRFKHRWKNQQGRGGTDPSGSGSAGAADAAPESNSIIVVPFNEDEPVFRPPEREEAAPDPSTVAPDDEDAEFEDDDEAGDYA